MKGSMSSQKSRSKAMKIAVGVAGVKSAAFGGQDMSEIEVVGDEFDVVKLVCLLRKQVGHSEILSVSAGGEKKEEAEVQQLVWPYRGSNQYVYAVPQYYQYSDSFAYSIM
ncbi:hypothetical protein JCGZ_01717 [Jatropha curcas]|uniref:HMA domain-containing protein n=1 Tax=Jatropha curcas TaxID=180498 RepID=A0A067JSL1_JATCU|nr:hypothetical protein JCGZ_01717 [Jatropha curcas]